MATTEGKRKRNHLIWIGPVLVLTGFISYYLVFARFPDLRDFPWVNLPWIWVGVVVGVVAVRRAFRSKRGRILGTLGLTLCLGVAAIFHLYIFYWSYLMPAGTESTLSMEAAADFTLDDQNGRPVTLTDLRGRNVVLVFYRGHW